MSGMWRCCSKFCTQIYFARYSADCWAMNFSPFGSHFPSSIPSIHQFSSESSGARYTNHFNQSPIGVPNVAKYRSQEAANNVQSSAPSQVMLNNKTAYTNSNVHHYSNSLYSQTQNIHQRPSNSPNISEKRNNYLQVCKINHKFSKTQMKLSFFWIQESLTAQDVCNMLQEKEKIKEKKNGEITVNGNGQQNFSLHQQQNSQPGMPASWQSLATPGSTVADYLSHLPASTLPLSLHHFLKYSAESIKKETEITQNNNTVNNVSVPNSQNHSTLLNNNKKKKKKKPPKEKKPRPKPGQSLEK